jgi:hypothetical protein
VADDRPRRDRGDNPGRLARAWRRAAAHTRKAALSSVLALSIIPGFTGVAQAETRDKRPPAATIVKADKNRQKYEFSQERLDKIEAKMRLTDTGAALLQFADDQHIRISMSDSKVMDSNPKDALFIKGRNYSTYILLNGETKSDDEIMITIAHELRHSWHERIIKSGDMDVTPRQHWLMRRLQEADAFSFEVHFAYEYEKATGKQLDLGDRWNACSGNTPFTCLAEQYRRDRDSGKPVADAYSNLLENALRHVHAMHYDTTFVGELDDGWGAVAAKPAAGAAYAGRFDNPVSDADFIARMRKVATAGLVPGTDPAALTKWQDADFLSFDKTGGKNKGDLKKLAAAEAKFTQSKDAWDKWDLAHRAPQQSPLPPSGPVP